MHVLVLSAGVFVLSLYLISVQALAVLLVLLILFITAAIRFERRMVTVLVIMPLLAMVSLTLYYKPQVLNEVRVTKVYSGSIVVQDGYRKYMITEELFDCKEGDLIEGFYILDPLPPGINGYAGNLIISEVSIKQDFLSKLVAFKKSLVNEVIVVYGYDIGGLMASLVLGSKDDIGEKRAGDMKDMGIMHILSISGFHFALLENMLKKMKLGRSSIIILGLYALFINSIPGYRTLLTITYRTIGHYIKRDPDPLTGICSALMIQTFLSPYIIFKIGFLLTYLATLGIVLFHQRILRGMYYLPSSVSKSLSLTLAALYLSFPVIISLTPEFSLGVFIGNMILVPLYAIVTYLSFLCILLVRFQVLIFLVLPFVEVFFDFSFHLGNFMSQYILTLNLEHIIYSYIFFVIIIGTVFHIGALKRGVLLLTLVLVIGLPWGSSVKIYNNFGSPFIRITHNFENYDIMDYRIAEGGYLPLRKEEKLDFQSVDLRIIPSEKEREIPHIYVNGKELAFSRSIEYFGGVKVIHKYVFWNERIIKVR